MGQKGNLGSPVSLNWSKICCGVGLYNVVFEDVETNTPWFRAAGEALRTTGRWPVNSPNPYPSRRQLLRGAGFLAGGIVLAGCSTAPSTGGGGGPQGGGPSTSAGARTGGTGGTGPLQWWDQFNPLADLHRETFASFDGGDVEYTVYNPAEQGQALQLAFSSQQLPDVFSLAGVEVPPSVLLGQGWFSPLAWDDSVADALPEGSIIEGIHVLDGQLYSFPIFSPRQYECLNWFNRGLVEQADLDPDDPPTSWDDFRSAARAVQEANDGVSGVILPLQLPPRMASFVLELAQTAGYPGSREAGVNGIDLTTGEYVFHTQPFLDTMEFLLSLQQDGLLFPASTSLDARAGRARWAAGGSGFIFDGPYNVGVIAGDFADFLPQLGVGPIPTPNGDTPVLTRPPTDGTFWVSGQSDQTDVASALLELFVTEEYQSGLAAAMDQPPVNIEAVADSDAHATYKQCVELFMEQVFVGPAPSARNPLVSQVLGSMAPVEPGLGAIVQGAFSGQVTDIEGALRQLSDAMIASRDAAIAQVGGDVSVADFAFENWEQGTDFGPEAYGS